MQDEDLEEGCIDQTIETKVAWIFGNVSMVIRWVQHSSGELSWRNQKRALYPIHSAINSQKYSSVTVMQDNAPAHRAKVSARYFEREVSLYSIDHCIRQFLT